MKIRSILLTGLLVMALAGCESTSGGGGLFSAASSPPGVQKWDLMMLLQTPPCPLGFPTRGASVNESFPGGYFPGVKVVYQDFMYSGEIPEVKILAYILGPAALPTAEALAIPPSLVAGDRVKVTFSYKTNADGLHGDYFLVRIADGDLFRVPVEVRGDNLAANEWRQASFAYTSKSDSFYLMFITGLSHDTDSIMIDNLHVLINGVEVLYDDLGMGEYTYPTPLAVEPVPSSFIRFPFLPANMQGAIMSVEGEETYDGLSLGFFGGSYFILDGMGGSSDDYSGVQLMLTEPNAMTPYYGQVNAMQMRSSYLGQYEGFDTSVDPTCTEDGQAIISVNPKGNADLSGDWVLQLQVACEDPNYNFGTDGLAVYGMTSIASEFMYFTGGSFTTVLGDTIFGSMGLSLGDAGFFMFNSAAGTAVLYGVYDDSTGVFAGQISGAVPIYGGVCNITSGQFVAVVGVLPAP